jgi:DNA-binding transcriptional LysR family regulator
LQPSVENATFTQMSTLTRNTLHTKLSEVLAAVQTADSGSFSAAAKVLDLTPAAVSKNVASLESALHVRLFNRTTRTLSLTAEGKGFVEQARVGLRALENAAAFATQGLAPAGVVRVNCAVGFGRRYVLPALPAFFRRFPEVQVDLSLADHAVDLVSQGFDIGIRGGSQPPEGMVARKICDVDSVLIATPRYLREHGVPKVPNDLVSHTLLRVRFLNGRMYPWTFKVSRSDAQQAIEAMDASHLESRTQLWLSDPEIMLDAVLLHMGIARMGRHHAHAALARGEVVEVLRDSYAPGSASMTMFYPHRAGLAPRVRVLVDYLLNVFGEDPSLRPAKKNASKPTTSTGATRRRQA